MATASEMILKEVKTVADNVQKVKAILDSAGIVYSNANEKQLKIEVDGPTPTDLLLMAVAGCSGITLRTLLERDGLTPERLEVFVEGVKSEDRPRRFTQISVKYHIKCEGLSEEALNKYLKITESACPVIQSLSAESHLEYTLDR